MPEESFQTKPQLNALTSLRFFAAFAIVILHATNHGLLPASWLHLLDWSKAVAFFFVLSGFVLTYAYAGRRYALRRFYQARFARVWPATAASILLVLILLPRGVYLPSDSSDWPLGFVLASGLLGLQAWLPVPMVFFGINAVTWSISVEAAFYGFFPFLQRLPMRALLITLIGLMLIGAGAANLVSFAKVPGFSPEHLNSQVWQGWVYINPIARLPEFLIGIFAGNIFLSDFFQNMIKKWHFWAKRLFVLPDVVEFAAIASLGWMGFRTQAWSFALPLQVVMNQWLSAIFFAGLLLVVAAGERFSCRLLNWKPLVFLGEVSFGLYLYHQPLMIRASQSGGFAFAGVQLLPNSFFAVLAWSLLISFASYFWLEIPAQKWFRPKST